jgi:hypothetical protein
VLCRPGVPRREAARARSWTSRVDEPSTPWVPTSRAIGIRRPRLGAPRGASSSSGRARVLALPATVARPAVARARPDDMFAEAPRRCNDRTRCGAAPAKSVSGTCRGGGDLASQRRRRARVITEPSESARCGCSDAAHALHGHRPERLSWRVFRLVQGSRHQSCQR